MKKTVSILLFIVLCLSLTVGTFASGEASGGSSGGAPDQNYGGTNEENSVIVIRSGVIEENNQAGSCELAPSGEIAPDHVSGAYITTAGDAYNGLYLSETTDDAAFTVGGEADCFTVEGVGQFNTVIEATGPVVDPNVENYTGVNITTAGGLLTLDNVYLHTSGYRSSCLYTMAGTESETTAVVKNSVLWAEGNDPGFIPDFKLLVGSARATLLMGEDIWFYNSAVLAGDWGALSHEMNTQGISMYAVNTYTEAKRGGYCLYALDGIYNYMYGCKFVSSQYGIFVMGAGEAYFGGIDDADEAALTYADGVDFSRTVTEDGRSLLAAPVNAVVFHVNGSVMDPGVLTIRNTRVSTMPEDVVSDYGTEISFDFDSYLLEPVICGESWFYLENCYGSLITTRSHGGIVNIEEGAELAPSNGVIVQTLVGYDSSAGSIYHDSTDSRVLKDVTVNVDAPVEGAILHQDYQRNMYLNVNAPYTGRVTTGTITSWNGLWTAEGLEALLAQGGHADDFVVNDESVAAVRACLVREEDTAAYTDLFGVYMTVSKGAVWTVEGESSVLSLTFEDGAVVAASEIYVNCSFGADGYLDPATGTAVNGTLGAGTYENVVLMGANTGASVG